VSYLWSQIPDAIRIARLLRERQVQIAHVNGGMFFAAGLAARLARARLIWHLNDTVVPTVLAVCAGRIAHWLSHRLIVASESVARHYGIATARHWVIYAPVDVDKYFPPPSQTETVGELCVGIVANWSPGKGIDDFVQAAGIVLGERNGDVRFEMAGARLENHVSYANAIDNSIHQQKFSGRLIYRGFLEDSSGFIRGLDILVLSSHNEACPMVVLEAMASGVAVVATDVGGIHELLTEGGGPAAGRVVPKRSPAQLAQALLSLLDDGNARRQFGKSGIERARERFSLNVCFGRHLEIYRSLA
jgi:glycosyltransferase involved in cell wall biosynthesis